jgi:mannose-1-phosphate guanylyltransferase
MLTELEDRKSHWCIVIADDHAPAWLANGALESRLVPVQYCRLEGSATLLHLALHRAASIAPTSQILVTALEEYRDQWEPILWCVRPEMRVISCKRTSPLLSSAAAILSIARISPSSIVTILPARCYVGHEWILRQALRQATFELPHIPEGAAALGMIDIDEGVHEDYMVLNRVRAGRGLGVQGIARRPTAWVARHLRRQGAVVSSGVMIGYASTFAAHISRHWLAIGQKIAVLAAMARAAQREFEIPNSLQDLVPGAVLKSLRWHPPAFPQRVFTVCGSGWSSLKSPQAVTRMAEFTANRMHRHQPVTSSPAIPNHGEPVAL